jgi:hypothetical protein
MRLISVVVPEMESNISGTKESDRSAEDVENYRENMAGIAMVVNAQAVQYVQLTTNQIVADQRTVSEVVVSRRSVESGADPEIVGTETVADRLIIAVDRVDSVTAAVDAIVEETVADLGTDQRTEDAADLPIVTANRLRQSATTVEKQYIKYAYS